MPTKSLKEIKERVVRISDAWKEGAPDVDFNGIKRSEFDAKITGAEAVDNEIADLEAQLDIKKAERDAKYNGMDADSVKVRNGVVGDPNFGDDSPLYGAMGFVRKSERASGLTRKKKTP